MPGTHRASRLPRRRSPAASGTRRTTPPAGRWPPRPGPRPPGPPRSARPRRRSPSRPGRSPAPCAPAAPAAPPGVRPRVLGVDRRRRLGPALQDPVRVVAQAPQPVAPLGLGVAGVDQVLQGQHPAGAEERLQRPALGRLPGRLDPATGQLVAPARGQPERQRPALPARHAADDPQRPARRAGPRGRCRSPAARPRTPRARRPATPGRSTSSRSPASTGSDQSASTSSSAVAMSSCSGSLVRNRATPAAALGQLLRQVRSSGAASMHSTLIRRRSARRDSALGQAQDAPASLTSASVTISTWRGPLAGGPRQAQRLLQRHAQLGPAAVAVLLQEGDRLADGPLRRPVAGPRRTSGSCSGTGPGRRYRARSGRRGTARRPSRPPATSAPPSSRSGRPAGRPRAARRRPGSRAAGGATSARK